jgi:hypothetical protein
MLNKRSILYVWTTSAFGPKSVSGRIKQDDNPDAGLNECQLGHVAIFRKRDVVTWSELGCETSERPTSKIRSGLLINGQTVAFRLLFRSTQDLRFSANPPQ